jgi:hypothetical protein
MRNIMARRRPAQPFIAACILALLAMPLPAGRMLAEAAAAPAGTLPPSMTFVTAVEGIEE